MMMMTTTTMATTVNCVMTSDLAPVITYGPPFYTIPPHVTPFQYSWFHIIFVLGAMYVAMLLTDWYEHIRHLSVSTLIMYTSYSGTSSVRARHHLQPMVMTSTSGALRRRCGCVSSVHGSACFFMYGVWSLRSSCLTGKFVTWPLVVRDSIPDLDSLISEC
jgi:hypothetical protein